MAENSKQNNKGDKAESQEEDEWETTTTTIRRTTTTLRVGLNASFRISMTMAKTMRSAVQVSNGG